jgi:sulfate permease, SulP family
MDRLQGTAFLQHLSGQVFLSQFDAVRELAPEVVQAAAPAPCSHQQPGR